MIRWRKSILSRKRDGRLASAVMLQRDNEFVPSGGYSESLRGARAIVSLSEQETPLFAGTSLDDGKRPHLGFCQDFNPLNNHAGIRRGREFGPDSADTGGGRGISQ